jgi:GntR family transcriptional regulator
VIGTRYVREVQPDDEYNEQSSQRTAAAVATLPRPRIVDDASHNSYAAGRNPHRSRTARRGTYSSHDGANMPGVMALVKVTRNDRSLLHEQVAAQIRQAIADGEAKPGERLPTARHLAAVMGVNTNTVLRALRQLRDEGLLELVQGRGTRVTGTPERSTVLTQVAALVQLGQHNGYTRAQLARLIQSAQ